MRTLRDLEDAIKRGGGWRSASVWKATLVLSLPQIALSREGQSEASQTESTRDQRADALRHAGDELDRAVGTLVRAADWPQRRQKRGCWTCGRRRAGAKGPKEPMPGRQSIRQRTCPAVQCGGRQPTAAAGRSKDCARRSVPARSAVAVSAAAICDGQTDSGEVEVASSFSMTAWEQPRDDGKASTGGRPR